jgi:predicted phosphoadenosine phosphosulfate sulfurtransferase
MRSEMKKNVYDLTMSRLGILFNEFDNIYISFSGGKDSSVLLNLCLQYVKENNLNIKIGVFHMDYEVQYNETLRYIDRICRANSDIIEVYRICVPFKVGTCTSMYQTFWRPWDDACKEFWVREIPSGSYMKEHFPFYKEEMWDYDFQTLFAQWYHRLKKARKTCCLVGIRTQESYHRWKAIHGNKRRYMYRNLQWTHELADNIYNTYPIYDWLTTDIWTANGRFGWDYNHLYDLYYQAGVPMDKQRVASPFISTAQESLSLYRAIDPDMWGKMVCRVNGVNFTALYGHTSVVARYKVSLPRGHTWESYMHFLLSTLPEETRLNYLQKLAVSVNFWRYKGGCLSEETIKKLQECGIEIEVLNYTNYKTTKCPVRMDYQDDIDISDFKSLPTFKRMCMCILKNDHLCKYMGFALTKKEIESKKRIMDFYQNIYTCETP